jgi:hypothetical protein
VEVCDEGNGKGRSIWLGCFCNSGVSCVGTTVGLKVRGRAAASGGRSFAISSAFAVFAPPTSSYATGAVSELLPRRKNEQKMSKFSLFSVVSRCFHVSPFTTEPQ